MLQQVVHMAATDCKWLYQTFQEGIQTDFRSDRPAKHAGGIYGATDFDRTDQ